MADLVVHPSIVIGPEDIVTADILNLLATPVVDLAIEGPVNDQNFLRNGNFYSSYWITATGMTCPVNVETSNANYWYVKPQGAAVTTKRSTAVPDANSLFSHEIDGAVGVTDVEFGQHISGDLSATLRRICTFSAQIFNNSGLVLSPKLRVYSAGSFNNFNITTLVDTVDLQTCANGLWTFVSVTFDLSSLSNVANGISLAVFLPSGALSSAGKAINFSRVKFQIGEIATEFADDVSLFVTAPSVDSTMLQDGCIARPGLFLPNVVPSGAYQAKSIHDGDIADATITSRCLDPSAITGSLGYTPINKAGDSGIGPGVLDFTNDDVVGTGSVAGSALRINTTAGNAANDGYFPAISFNRPGTTPIARAVGLDVNARFKTVDSSGTVGFLLDSITKVDTTSYQDGSITYAKLAQSLINFICPVGMIMVFGGPNAPGGWFVCDGTEISRTTYAALFTVIGTYWGPGDNVSTFNLPDLRGRAPIGYTATPPSGITSRVFGTRGGEENHVLLNNELAAHSHPFQDPGHAHPYHDIGHTHGYFQPAGTTIGVVSGATPITYPSGKIQTDPAGSGITIDSAPTHAVVLNNVGGDGAHNNMMPFAVCHYIIKAT